MNRRQFLLSASSTAILAALGRQVFAVPMGGHAGHDMAAMPGMAMGAPADPSPVLKRLRLPSGRPLATVPRLVNRGGAGRFVGTLSAAPVTLNLAEGGVKTTAWAYNGQLPGPAIVAREGDSVEIVFTNRLNQPTTIHWHGMPVPADQDGNPHDPVKPGESRTYRFTLPKGSAGSYWYHPHPHGHTAEQVFRGLAGVFVVEADDDPLRHLAEDWLVLSDLRLDERGAIPANTAADWHDGREGQFLLVNGALRPVIALGQGERRRWRVWNATSARILKLALPGLEWQQVGSDGGLLGAPRALDTLMLAPGERAELVVSGSLPAGKSVALQSLPYTRGRAMTPEQTAAFTVATVKFGPPVAGAAVPAQLRQIPALGEPQVRRTLTFSENMADPASMFRINGQTFDMNRIDFTGRVGDIEEWDIVSEAHMDHPFHLHGTQFQVVARNDGSGWVAEPFLAWRDVINVPLREAVRIRFRQDLPGMRMYHCHILEHEDQGMMGQHRVSA
ncbi:multicopper oxidase family protein [Crenobacter sp. SG2303]|uniref:Multicopper oxidase family protein n=1 Tax=Crenobacter oryzisoli TaxID=3056844 RepID=A0ABT7XHZ5_9NEIS|nr:multicopper oxidase family protein [Crenobacter sp. SG2303]MDN0073406.1 multicopper oxidase family protein [Crenobacter sp. SG2303]